MSKSVNKRGKYSHNSRRGENPKNTWKHGKSSGSKKIQKNSEN